MNFIAAITNRLPTLIQRVRIFQTTGSLRGKLWFDSRISQKWKVMLRKVKQVKQSSSQATAGNGARTSEPAAASLGTGTGEGQRRELEPHADTGWCSWPGSCQPLLQVAVFTEHLGHRRNHYPFPLQFSSQNGPESILAI